MTGPREQIFDSLVASMRPATFSVSHHATDETYQVALNLGSRLVDLAEDPLARIGTSGDDWWSRQHA